MHLQNTDPSKLIAKAQHKCLQMKTIIMQEERHACSQYLFRERDFCAKLWTCYASTYQNIPTRCTYCLLSLSPWTPLLSSNRLHKFLFFRCRQPFHFHYFLTLQKQSSLSLIMLLSVQGEQVFFLFSYFMSYLAFYWKVLLSALYYTNMSF